MSPSTIVFILEFWFSTTTPAPNIYEPGIKLIPKGETIEQTIAREAKEQELQRSQDRGDYQ